jgi:hypothetical protein
LLLCVSNARRGMSALKEARVTGVDPAWYPAEKHPCGQAARRRSSRESAILARAAMTDLHGPGQRLSAVAARIEAAARAAGRQPEAVRLVAVSKTFGPDSIVPLLEAGQRVFGENRVQEARGKWPALRERYPGVALHLIGPLQSNKARDAVALFDVIQTVDRPKIALALAQEMARSGRRPQLFVQVNTGDESQKAGAAVAETPALVALCREQLGLAVEGLMCIPPVEADPAPHFALLARMAGALRLPKLSMGMSADFETAIRHGATHVRIGSALFGARD